MSYAVVARCGRSGQFGIAVASYSMAIGRYLDGAMRANTGAVQSIGAPNPRLNYLAMNLLAEGRNPRQVMADLVNNDEHAQYRCMALVSREGEICVHTGAKLREGTFHKTGEGFVAFGTSLAGVEVVGSMAEAFDADAQRDLDERLMLALEAGCAAGGIRGRKGRLPERSCGLSVWGNKSYNELDLRVDLHPAAIADLRRIHTDYRPSIAYYEERARHPRNAIPAMEFVDMLARKQKETA